ncbi:GIY-YIG nuclease family protein [Mycolicibacterium fortuitum]|uniref:GIY-YIG nuclease family protein n=1 Tax=Mycolicibacterium fortuitum TaxID=1766 RepID=A0AAE4VJ10_MYCFO|nr:GIY-YIG nuclease family protein [Mycolicibacterium fortuitum]MDV7195867.1 GIY-YIG nuclease family protein [Mycolicibacterium fortuitum]MDV7207645.1 GIY-YIG nuclease family protein [Mycolicibacterium fortuitum]MDV7229701.1 GIY-YIG nuclease family protein [Mycolicibacterium fortuitum]MDV7261546.1 GIY-YIG nuclease family protein [Mycolicibacterium fortuitum]MDV7286674.1 GIY-YIG nuclease family protein [Mycolicibacterium fortuitum]
MAIDRVLYRVYDSDGDLLYLGATTNPGLRFGDHDSTKSWWPDAANITLEHFPSTDELLDAERAAIQAESPRYNLVHTGKPSTTVHRRKGEARVFRRSDGMWTGCVELPPGDDGKRRQKRVYSTDKDEAMRKLAALRAELTSGD